MLFALICTDKTGALQTRLETRPAHLAYLEKLNAEGKLAFAGAFTGEDGKSNGSLVVIKAADRDSAQSLAAEDPYAKAGLFASVEIRAWNWTVNNPAGAA